MPSTAHTKTDPLHGVSLLILIANKMPFYKICSQFVELGTLNKATYFFSRDPTKSGDFKKNNVRIVGNAFTQDFLSVCLYFEIGRKS